MAPRDEAAIRALGTELALTLGIPLPPSEDSWLEAEWELWGKPHPGQPRNKYLMVWTPEGIAVHQGLGCEHVERTRQQTTCWHSKENGHMVTQDKSLVVAGVQAIANPVTFDADKIKVLKNTICRGASDNELQMFMHVCTNLQLDPFLKQIHCVMRDVKVSKRGEPDRYEPQMTIQVGVDGYRSIRDRLVDEDNRPLFDGMEGPQWSFDGVEWQDFPPGGGETYDELYARVAIYRRGIARPFIEVKRMSAEYQDNAMWKKRGPEMLAKTAEVGALRKTFPKQMNDLPVALHEDEEPEQLTVAQAFPDGVPTDGSLPAAQVEDDDVIDADYTEADAPVAAQEAAEPSQPSFPGDSTPAKAPAPAAAPKAQAKAPAQRFRAPVDVLNDIAAKMGTAAAIDARRIMPRVFDKQDILALDNDERRVYSAMLETRLNNPTHTCELGFSVTGEPHCKLCGTELPPDFGSDETGE